MTCPILTEVATGCTERTQCLLGRFYGAAGTFSVDPSSNFEFASTSIPAGVDDALSFAFVIKLLAIITLMCLRFLEPTTVSGELS